MLSCIYMCELLNFSSILIKVLNAKYVEQDKSVQYSRLFSLPHGFTYTAFKYSVMVIRHILCLLCLMTIEVCLKAEYVKHYVAMFG